MSNINLRGAITARFELTRKQLGEHLFRHLVLFTVLNGYGSLASAGRYLVERGLEAVMQNIKDQVKENANIGSMTESQYVNAVMSDQGYTNIYDDVLKKYNCSSLDDLMIKLHNSTVI